MQLKKAPQSVPQQQLVHRAKFSQKFNQPITLFPALTAMALSLLSDPLTSTLGGRSLQVID
jgi:hypothetical protein